MTQRMSQDPDPAAHPPSVTRITYDVTNASLPVELKITLDTGETWWHTVTAAKSSHFNVNLPERCGGGVIQDMTGQSDDFAISVTP